MAPGMGVLHCTQVVSEPCDRRLTLIRTIVSIAEPDHETESSDGQV